MSWNHNMSCCQSLTSSNAQLQVALPYTAAYNSTLAAYWSIQESSLLPSCIVTPQTSQDVVDIISTLTCHGSCQSEAFAIKSHGHSPASGFANIGPTGLTIDLTSLNSVTYSKDHSIASVGSGASWLQVYAALDPIGKSVAGGRNGAVGVGGLTLGGGISYFSPQIGFTCDTVTNFEIVLASGHLVNANSSSNADLFRALKGGGNNFGVVTRFDFETVDIGQIMAGNIAHPVTAGSRAAVFQAFANIAAAPNYDVHASLVTGLIFNATSKQWALSSTPIYTLPELNPPVYDELYAAPNLTSSKQLISLHTLANETATPPLNWLFRTGTYGVSAALLEKIFDICNTTLYNLQPSGTLLWDIALEPLPSVLVSKGQGQNILGTSSSDGNSMVMLLSALWTNSSASTAVQAKADAVLAEVDATAASMSLSKQFVYANYAGAKQKPYHSYRQQNDRLLHQVARKYDPEGVFQRRVPASTKDIYGFAGNYDKSNCFNKFLAYSERSIYSILDGREHRHVAKRISAFYRPANINNRITLQPVRANVRRIIDRLMVMARRRSTVDILPLCSYFAFDNVIGILFGPHLATRTVHDNSCMEQEILSDRMDGELSRILQYSLPLLFRAWRTVVFCYTTKRDFLPIDDKLAAWTMANVVSGIQDPESMAPGSMLRLLHNTKTDGDPVSNSRIAAELLNNIHAGHCTVAITATHALWHLARHPLWQGRVRDELTTLPMAEDGLPAHDAILSAPTLNACILESARLNPISGGRSERVLPATKVYSDVVVPAGTIVSTSTTAMRNKPGIFPLANEYTPERWLEADEAVLRVMESHFMPFGHGA